jgi:hypothetical protein
MKIMLIILSLALLAGSAFAAKKQEGEDLVLKGLKALNAEVSTQEEKLCAVQKVNRAARNVLSTAEAIYSNLAPNLTVVKMHVQNCLLLAQAISNGEVPQISQPMVQKVMSSFCTESKEWSFPTDGNNCDESKYYN